MISNLIKQIGNHTNAQIEENMLRHMILNSLRSYRQKFKQEYGELVIACDGHNYWRKRFFPYYKASRKVNREKSELDWNQIFTALNKIRDELKEFFPYPIIDVETAEADDVIAALCKSFKNEQEILILSGDKDFIQLHDINVKQYDPVNKKNITSNGSKEYLFNHILKGDFGDGIPNILSPDNCLVIGERQKSLTKKWLDKLKDIENGYEDAQIYKNFLRNKQLIDLSQIPLDLLERITDNYKLQLNKKRDKLLQYFINHKLKNLISYLQEF